LPQFGDDPFEVALDNLREESQAAPCDVGQVLHAGSAAWHRSTQDPLPLDERRGPQVATIEPETVERDEARGATAVEQRVEEGTTIVIEADDLAIKNRVPHAPERDGDLAGQLGEALEDVAIAGDEPTRPALHVGECSEAVELQLEKPASVVERLTP